MACFLHRQGKLFIMKNAVFKIFPVFSFVIILLLLFGCKAPQSITKGQQAQNIKAAIDSNSWTFTALNVQPQTGRSQMVNGLYTVVSSADSLNVYLPYFGRAFSGADIYGSSKSVLDFISTNFSFDKQNTKEGKWTILMIPKDQREIQTMTFTFFSNGSASLAVVLTNRTPINFTGTLAARKKK
ncbi:MAG: DUF4251 domain-containing protein [Chitinophagaceae bacterium]|nr:MAG: DUF4251 domain-containing protein [Chitinophagaceae bacterium]